MLEIRPLRMTLVPPGTFDGYYDEKQRQGEDLGRSLPPKMNAFDDAIADLLRIAGEIEKPAPVGVGGP